MPAAVTWRAGLLRQVTLVHGAAANHHPAIGSAVRQPGGTLHADAPGSC